MNTEPMQTKVIAARSSRTLWSAPLAVAITFLLVGCYTILKHPITSEENITQASHQEYYRDNCLDCHEDYATYPYGFFYGTYPEYYFEYPRWGHYYAYPWWWDHYWYDDSEAATGDEGYSEEVPEPSAKASRRGGLIPPYVGGAPAISTGGGSFRRSDPDATQTKGGTGGEPGTASPGTSTDKIRVKKADQPGDGNQSDTVQSDTKQQKKASRRGGIKP